MLHLILVYTVGDMRRAKLIRCHRTKPISATTLACMGRPWLSLPVGSLMRITKVGRLCVRGYPDQVSGDSLESRLLIWGRPHLGLFATTMAVLPRWWSFCHDGGRFASMVAVCHAMV